MAADDADEEGLVGYLSRQAIANPVAFMALLGKVLPMQLTGQGSGPLEVRWLPHRSLHGNRVCLGDPLPPGPQNGWRGAIYSSIYVGQQVATRTSRESGLTS